MRNAVQRGMHDPMRRTPPRSGGLALRGPLDLASLETLEAQLTISVVIPAHNESAVIGRCLEAMLQGAGPAEIEVIVVCNGCEDDTAARARAFGEPVRAIETDVASKSHALNLGDRAARGFPRFYVDADVVLPLASIRRVAAALERGPMLAAAPRLELDESGSSWAVRAYHRIWMNLPYVTDRMLGSGVYAISRAGRERFDSFPDIIGDDEFIRMLFAPHEKISVQEVPFFVTPPRNLPSLIHINVRRRVGYFEMQRLYPDVSGQEARKQRLALRQIAARPVLWVPLVVYAWAKLCTVVLFAWRRRSGAEKRWARDATSRSSSALPPGPR